MTGIADVGAWLAGASALVGGALGALRPFLISEEVLDQRVKLHSSVIIEKATQRYTASLERLWSAEDVADLRGSPPKKPDVAGEFVAEMARVLAVLDGLKRVQQTVSRCYAMLLGSIGIAVLAAIGAAAWKEAGRAVFFGAIALVAMQFALACVVRHQASRLRRYEQTT